MRKGCRAQQIDYVQMRTDQSLDMALSSYLASRMNRVEVVELMFMPIPLMLAFGFGNLLMLGWLAAAAAPILIHLWNKRRYREVPWAAIEYLLAALRKNSRRMRLEQWLLLAVRTLIDRAASCWPWPSRFLEQAGLALRAGPADAQGAGDRRLVLDGLQADRQEPLRAGQATGRADRRRELAGRRLHAGADGLAAARDRGHAGRRAAAISSTRSTTSSCRTAAPICRPRWSRSNRS